MPGELESPAAVTETSVELRILVGAFSDVAERALSSGDFSGITSSDLELVTTAAVKLYAAKAEVEEGNPRLRLRPVKIEIVDGDVVVTVPEGGRERIARARSKRAEPHPP